MESFLGSGVLLWGGLGLVVEFDLYMVEYDLYNAVFDLYIASILTIGSGGFALGNNPCLLYVFSWTLLDPTFDYPLYYDNL